MDIVQLTEVLGNVGEFVGSIVVLITLIYLAVQVRHSRELLERQDKIAMSSVYTQRILMRMQFVWQSIGSPDTLRDMHARRFEHEANNPSVPYRDVAPPEDKVSIRQWNSALMLHQDHNLYQYELGLLDEGTMEITHEVIMGSFEIWKDQGLQITPRVSNYYEAQNMAGAEEVTPGRIVNF